MAISPSFDRNDIANWTLIGEVQSDGSFTIILAPDTYDLIIMERPDLETIRTVTVQGGQINNIGTFSAR